MDFLLHYGINFDCEASFERLLRAHMSPQSPRRCAPNQWFMIVKATNKRRDIVLIGAIAEHNSRIAKEATTFGPPQWRLSKPGAKLVFVQIKELTDVDRILILTRLKTSQFTAVGKPVPRAHILADITTEQPVLHLRAQFDRNGPPMFNR